jgi:hypothetical protein
MFWLFDNNISNEYKFYQVFPFYKKYKDNASPSCTNYLYDFTSVVASNNIANQITTFDLTKFQHVNINYQIKIKGRYISYFNSEKNKLITFSKNDEFIKESDEQNHIQIPTFSYKYILCDNAKIPNIIIKDYDFYYSNINFDLYLLNKNTIYVIEKCGDIIKKYIFAKILDSKQILTLD